MAPSDYDKEKSIFREFYSDNVKLLEGAVDSYKALISSLLTYDENIYVSQVEGRIKDKEECIRKFNLKYRKSLEAKKAEYTIKEHISDLIGLRVVCLYEDDIEKIKQVLKKHFDVIDETDKISQVESTEDSFGYKGLHLDLKLGDTRSSMPEYKAFVDLNFEIQIRTIIQDSWSVLDHKIKYKKSIPNRLKRRINTLAALFELADREFKEIRLATEEEIKKAEAEDQESSTVLLDDVGSSIESQKFNGKGALDAFGFLKIAKHFFSDFEFEDFKVDGFAEEIALVDRGISKTEFNKYMKEAITKVKSYKQYFEYQSGTKEILNPYTIIRHCLYMSDKEKFSGMLTTVSKEAFDKWLQDNG